VIDLDFEDLVGIGIAIVILLVLLGIKVYLTGIASALLAFLGGVIGVLLIVVPVFVLPPLLRKLRGKVRE